MNGAWRGWRLTRPRSAAATDCIMLLCIFSFSVLFYTSSGYYQLIDLLDIRRLHQLCKFFILKLWHHWRGLKKLFWQFSLNHYCGPQLCYLCRGAKLNNSCGCPLSRGMLAFTVINCTKFGQLILRKIIKIIANRCQIFRLKCTKFDFGWSSPCTDQGEIEPTVQQLIPAKFHPNRSTLEEWRPKNPLLTYNRGQLWSNSQENTIMPSALRVRHKALTAPSVHPVPDHNRRA